MMSEERIQPLYVYDVPGSESFGGTLSYSEYKNPEIACPSYVHYKLQVPPVQRLTKHRTHET